MVKKTTSEEKIENGDPGVSNELFDEKTQELIDEDDHKKKIIPKKKSKTAQLQNKIEELKEQLEDVKEQNLRINAEFQNQRKRLDRERGNIISYANEKLIESLLPIIDDFERSLEAPEDKKTFKNFREGVELIYKNLLEALSREGLKPIESMGEKFDYNLHEALLQTEKEGTEPDTIIEEVLKGYYYKDKILRHSKVVVAK